MASKEIRSCFLGRVSTKLESQESSLVNQKDLIIKFIQEQKEIFNPSEDCYEDTVSGVKLIKNNENVKGYDTLMQALNIEIVEENNQNYEEVLIHFDKTHKPRYNKIYCKSTSRLSRAGCRGQSLLEILKQNGIEIYFYDLHKSSNDMSDIELTIYFYIDNQYSKTMSSNTRNNRVLKTLNREIMIHGTRFGWDLIKKNTKRYYVKNEEEYKVLRKIIKLLLEEDKGCNLIEQELEKQGIKSSKIKLDKCNINRILKDKHYLGMEKYYKYKNDYTSQFMVGRDYLKSLDFEWLKCDYIEPLITQEEYDLIQDKLQSRSNYGRGFRAPMKPLSKKLICTCCGQHYYSLGSCNYFKIESYKCSSKRSPKTKLRCNNHPLYMDFFNEWVDKKAKELRIKINDICNNSIMDILNLKHHLALILASNNSDSIDNLLEQQETLYEQINERIAMLIESATPETMDIIKKFQEQKSKELREVNAKIDTYFSLRSEVMNAIKEVSKIENEIDKLQDSIKDTYTREEYLEEVKVIYVYPINTSKRKRNNLILLPLLNVEVEIYNLLDNVVHSPIMSFLEKDTIRLSEVQYTKRYIVKEVPKEQLETSVKILEDLNS